MTKQSSSETQQNPQYHSYPAGGSASKPASSEKIAKRTQRQQDTTFIDETVNSFHLDLDETTTTATAAAAARTTTAATRVPLTTTETTTAEEEEEAGPNAAVPVTRTLYSEANSRQNSDSLWSLAATTRAPSVLLVRPTTTTSETPTTTQRQEVVVATATRPPKPNTTTTTTAPSSSSSSTSLASATDESSSSSNSSSNSSSSSNPYWSIVHVNTTPTPTPTAQPTAVALQQETTTVPPTTNASTTSSSSPPPPPPPLVVVVDRSVIHLVLTEATLLSGSSLEDCASVDDESCTGGVAAVSAYVRHFTKQQQQPTQPTLVFPKFEKQSQFVQVHPLGWSVNRLILQGLLKWNVFMSTPSLLLQNARDNYGSQRDLTYLQERTFPFLLSNVQVPPSLSWGANSEYHKYIHFDDDTGIALMSIANSDEPLNHPQVESIWGSLWIVHDRNVALGNECGNSDTAEADNDSTSPEEETRKQQELFASYQDIYLNGPSGQTTTTTTESSSPDFCWIPVVVFDDGQEGNFQTFIQGIMRHPYPPALIIDVDKQAVEEYPYPMLIPVDVPVTIDNTTLGIPTGEEETTTTTTTKTKSVWIHSFGRKDDVYYQHQIFLGNERPPRITNITLIEADLEVLPEAYKDDIYARHITYLRQQADQAIQNDPQVGFSTAFPVARAGEYRRCQAGECEIGNLFADALRWKADADVAFVTSGGLRGEGWPAGPVHMSNIWSSLPFPNSLCTGTMSGISLFQMLDYSIRTATFEGEDTNDGERLLQLSGMQVVYNTQIPIGTSRIIGMKVWDDDEEKWLDVERLSMYSFVTDSYMCSAYDPFPEFLGANGNYTLEGEVPGTVNDYLVQNVVAEYLGQLEEPYNASIHGRLVNNTEVFEVLDLVQTIENCPQDTYWSIAKGGCLQCPDSTFIEFTDEYLEFDGQIGSEGGIIPNDDSKASSVIVGLNSNLSDMAIFDNVLQGRIMLLNREMFNFTFSARAIPSWLKFIDATTGDYSEQFVVGGPPTLLPSGSSYPLNFVVGDHELQAGTATGTVSFDISGQSLYPADEQAIRVCDSHISDVAFDVMLKLSPPNEEIYLGNARYVGLSLMAIALLTATFFGTFLLKNRTTMILRTMQPFFLMVICSGAFVMALTILPLSLDDEVLSESDADIACTSIPWLLSMGMTFIFSAIFSKLWRVNRLFSAQSYRRVVVRERDVIAPFVLLFTLNTVLLITWTVIDPLSSERLPVEDEEWKSYAACRTGDVGRGLMYSIAGVNMLALILACYQAYRARNISDEFSESRNFGLAVGCWLQVLLVGFPALYLVDPDDTTTNYYLQVGLLFVLTMTLLIIIFGPLTVKRQ